MEFVIFPDFMIACVEAELCRPIILRILSDLQGAPTTQKVVVWLFDSKIT